MASIVSIATFAGFASLAVASPLVESQMRTPGFRIDQVHTGYVKRSGPVAMKKVLEKYGKPVPEMIAVAAATATSGTVEADPHGPDREFLCPVTVGGKTLHLDFDTGSADLWVFSSELSPDLQAGHSIYTPDPSKKIPDATWIITYADRSGASGDVYADTVSVGKVTATSQAVEAASSISAQFTKDNNDGLVGLAFSSLNYATPQQKTFFDNVKGNLKQALFCANLKAGAAGSYDFGFIDKTQFTGDIDYTPIDNSKGNWMFTTDGYAIGGTQTSTPIRGIADTGTTLLVVNDAIVQAYYAQVPGTRFDTTVGGYTFSCSTKLPDFSLIINGNKHTIPGSYINHAPVDSTNCFGGIQSNDGIGFSIFGDVFLKSQYVIFDDSQDSPRIGFGQKSVSASGHSKGHNATSSAQFTQKRSPSLTKGGFLPQHDRHIR